MANERKTDLFIAKLLDLAEIKYTPNGSDVKEIKEALKSASKRGTGKAGYPEYIGISKDFVVVIENKAELEHQAYYSDTNESELCLEKKSVGKYAENGALHYAIKIAKDTSFKKVFAFGCSGDEKHHKIRPIFVDGAGEYILLKEVENFENFTESNIDRYYREQVLGETPPETAELESILEKSKDLNEDLRLYGQLGDSEKPLVVSAIILALREESFSVDSLTHDDLKTDGEKIYEALSTYMSRVKVQPGTKKDRILHQFTIIKDRPLLNRNNEELGKSPLRYFVEYIRDKVLSFVVASSYEDVLGRFYGEFIRYTGGDGQTLGVVLTPKHITELFCELVDIKPSDVVFDPCCGTGGFLIASMHHMLEKADSSQLDHIKKEQIHGIEVRPDMFSIATTNMILRGDGKSNLLCDDFLKYPIDELRKKKFTVGLMNPPYSQAKKKVSSHLSEIRFVERLLDSLADGGRCAVIVPQSTMVGKTKEDRLVKKEILRSHSLEGVITLNRDTFYGVGTNPCIAIFTAHTPHPKEKLCKFINYQDDGFKVYKHIGLVATERVKERRARLLQCWKWGADAESRFMVKTKVVHSDEWLHSFYYFNDEIPKESDFDKTVTDYLTFEFSMIMQGRGYLFDNGEQHDS